MVSPGPADPASLVVKVPTLVIWGERDPYLLPSNLDGLEEYVSDLTVKRIPDGTHWVIHEQPALVNSYLREFIPSAPVPLGASKEIGAVGYAAARPPEPEAGGAVGRGSPWCASRSSPWLIPW